MEQFIEKLKEAIMAASYEDRAGRTVIGINHAMAAIDRVAAEQPKDNPLSKVIAFIKRKQEERELLGDFP